MITEDSFHSSIAAELIDYISLKQALGRSFQNASIILSYLDRFLCEIGAPPADLSAETFRRWCQTMGSVSSTTRLARMHIVRNFCLYRRRRAPDCFVPDPIQFPKASPRAEPYIFSDIEVAKLLHHSNSIPVLVRSPLRAATTRLAIILLYHHRYPQRGTASVDQNRLQSPGANPRDSLLQVLQVSHPAFAERCGDRG